MKTNKEINMTRTRIVVAAMALLTGVATSSAADLEFLRELVAIPSSSTDIPQVNRAMQAMKAYLEKRGVWCVIETTPKGNEMLFAATKPGKEQDYVLSVHLDTVPPSIPGHCEMKSKDGKLLGRGVFDCKCSSTVAAATLVKLNGKASVGCIFGADEEIGGFTTTWMVEEKGYRPRKMAIVIDAGYGELYYAQKGQCVVRITAKGRGGHSSRPWDCDDSITHLVREYLKLREIWDARHPAREDKWWDVMTPTVVRSDGDAHNRIPDEVSMVLNLRSVNPGAKDELIALVRSETDLGVELVRYSPPVASDPNHPLMLKLSRTMSEVLGKKVSIVRMLAATDARCFVSCDVPKAIVGCLGGDAHGNGEWADPESFGKVEEYLERFILESENR